MDKHLKPCRECPFNKQAGLNKKDHLGGSETVVYIGQARGPFWLPCHMDKAYKGKTSDPAVVDQCRGAAIFRANCGIDHEMPPQLLHLPEDRKMVFDSFEEFLSHYEKISIEESTEFLKMMNPEFWMQIEMGASEVKVIPKTKL